jgi:hypothetical protein
MKDADDPQQYADIVVFCDESGAKGYADKPERISGEIGVFAGFFVPRSHLAQLDNAFRAALSRFRAENRKLHIADVAPEQREPLRQAVYGLLLSYRIPCFYEAIHTEGFHDIHKRQVEALKKLISSQGASARTDRHGTKGRLLHAELFQAFYGRVLAFCAKAGKTALKIEVLVDRVDEAILKQFRADAKRLLEDQRRFEKTIRNPVTGEMSKAKITLTLVGHPPPVTIRECLIRSATEHDELLLATDVLANSINYYLLNRPAEEKFCPLNSREAIATHPLAPLLNLHRLARDFSDSFLAHPLNPDRAKVTPQEASRSPDSDQGT